MENTAVDAEYQPVTRRNCSWATGVKLAADTALASRDSVYLFGLALRDIQMPVMEGDETMPFGMAEPVAQQEFEESVSLFA